MATDLQVGLSEAANTWYSVWVESTTRGQKSRLRILFSTALTNPTPHDWYTRYERVGWRRNNAAQDFYRAKNDPGSNLFWWNEDISASDFQVKNGSVAVANTWEDVDCSIPVPPGATHAMLDVKIFQVAPGLLIMRWKDKDLGNIGNVNDTFVVQSREHGNPLFVGVDANRVAQVQSNVVVPTIEAFVKGYEDVRAQ
jgi:hypothetical protein